MKCIVCGISRVFDQRCGFTYPENSVNYGLFICSNECKESRIRIKSYTISFLKFKMEKHRSSYLN